MQWRSNRKGLSDFTHARVLHLTPPHPTLYLPGTIRSAFLMTEPAVASSDATNIACTVREERNMYVINGRKWWSSGAMDPRCKVRCRGRDR